MKTQANQTQTMKSNLAISLLLALPLMIAACDKGGYTGTGPSNKLLQERKSAENPTPSPAPKERSVITEANLELSKSVILANDASNKDEWAKNTSLYNVLISLPNEVAKDLTIKRWHENEKAYEETNFIHEQDQYGTFYRDNINLAGASLKLHKYRYEVYSGQTLLKKFEVQVKPDVLIQGELSSSNFEYYRKDGRSTMNAGTIYIDAYSKFLVDEADLDINADRIVSLGSISAAKPHGFVQVKTLDVYGTLAVHAYDNQGEYSSVKVYLDNVSPGPRGMCNAFVTFHDGTSPDALIIGGYNCNKR